MSVHAQSRLACARLSGTGTCRMLPSSTRLPMLWTAHSAASTPPHTLLSFTPPQHANRTHSATSTAALRCGPPPPHTQQDPQCYLTCCHTLSATSFHTMTLPSNEAVASRLPNLGCAQHTCRVQRAPGCSTRVAHLQVVGKQAANAWGATSAPARQVRGSQHRHPG